MNMTMRINNFDNYPNFDWDLVRNFYFVAKLGVGEAAEKLGMTPSKLMKKIDILENKLGFPLLIRDIPIMPVDLTLTQKGEKLMDFLVIIFRELLCRRMSEIF